MDASPNHDGAVTSVEQNTVKPCRCFAVPTSGPQSCCAARKHVLLRGKMVCREMCLNLADNHIHSAATLLGAYGATPTTPQRVKSQTPSPEVADCRDTRKAAKSQTKEQKACVQKEYDFVFFLIYMLTFNDPALRDQEALTVVPQEELLLFKLFPWIKSCIKQHQAQSDSTLEEK